MKNEPIKERRYGKFFVERHLLRGLPADVLRDFFKDFIITDARYSFSRDGIEYTAASHLFEPCPKNIEPNFYEIESVWTHRETGGGSISRIKVAERVRGVKK